MKTIDQIRTERLKKIEKLSQLGIDPYPSFCCKKTTVKEARTMMDKQVEIVGRIFTIRGHGKLIFADLKDETEKIQLMLKYDELGEKNFEKVSLLDAGDFVEAKGKVTKTVKGEVSILVSEINFLSKAIRPLPEKWHGLKDIEERYRQRYVDLLVNPEVKEIFLTRTKIVTLIRSYLDKSGFIEVETPVLQPVYGGASAKPFTTYHNALDSNLYLRIADELYLKRLIVGGFEKVYEIGKDFRNEGLSRSHNPEFTMVEFYWAYADYNKLMEFTEEMIFFLVKEIKGSTKLSYNDKDYDFKTPWKRITYGEMIKEYLGIDIDVEKTEEDLKKVLDSKKVAYDRKDVGYRNILDGVYKKHIRPKLDGPLFITDYPIEMKPLAKRVAGHSEKSASFQLLVAGEEFVNSYNELNDPQDQKERWKKEMELGKKGAEDYQVLDEDFIRALEYGMPPTAGWGMGIDRLTAFLTNQHTIKDVILFPTLRPENNRTTTTVKNPQSDIVGMITREKAFEIVNSHIKNKNLVKHCLAVEAAMRELAKHFGEDEEKWGLAGLLHDADWEECRDDIERHTLKTVAWIKETGEGNKEIIRTILSHNFAHNGEPQPENKMEWALYTCDEPTGLIVATTLVIPDKKLSSVTIESVMKKFNTKAFAAGVDRNQIKLCEEKLGIPLQEFLGIILDSMKNISNELGL